MKRASIEKGRKPLCLGFVVLFCFRTRPDFSLYADTSNLLCDLLVFTSDHPASPSATASATLTHWHCGFSPTASSQQHYVGASHSELEGKPLRGGHWRGTQDTSTNLVGGNLPLRASVKFLGVSMDLSTDLRMYSMKGQQPLRTKQTSTKAQQPLRTL